MGEERGREEGGEVSGMRREGRGRQEGRVSRVIIITTVCS